MRVAFRVGVNIGDVIVEPHDFFGDGVNIAARLEGIAEPSGICMSSAVYNQVRGKVGVEFADLGEQNLKNIALPVRAYAVVQDGSYPQTPVGRRSGALSAPRLSIVVLPFTNLSGDPRQDYFVDAVTESLTTDLSRINGSFVIVRNSAFADAVEVLRRGIIIGSAVLGDNQDALVACHRALHARLDSLRPMSSDAIVFGKSTASRSGTTGRRAPAESGRAGDAATGGWSSD